MTEYEIMQTANALIGGGWTGEDEEFFREEDAKQERPLDPNDITKVFDKIRRIEKEDE